MEPKWLAGPDEDREKCVLNLEDMDMVEDDAMEFQFTFRDCRELVHLQKAKVGKSSPNGVGKSQSLDTGLWSMDRMGTRLDSLQSTCLYFQVVSLTRRLDGKSKHQWPQALSPILVLVCQSRILRREN